MGEFADDYDESAAFGLALLTRFLELEVQYSPLAGDKFAEEWSRYGRDIPSVDVLILSAGIRMPVSQQASLVLGGEWNGTGADCDIHEDWFFVIRSRRIEIGVNGGAEVVVPLGTSTDLLFRMKAHWLPDPKVYFLTLGVGASLSTRRQSLP